MDKFEMLISNINVGSWKIQSEIHRCYIQMDVRKCVDVGTTYEGNYGKNRVKLFDSIQFFS